MRFLAATPGWSAFLSVFISVFEVAKVSVMRLSHSSCRIPSETQQSLKQIKSATPLTQMQTPAHYSTHKNILSKNMGPLYLGPVNINFNALIHHTPYTPG